jgi:hypothetical protein
MLLTMGLPAIDQSLDKLLAAMETFPKAALMGDAVGFARVIGLCLALCMGSYECWMMMLGKRGMDVMKLLRIVGLSMCITSSTWICNQLLIPGKALENTTKTMAIAKNKQVAALELKVAEKQDGYLKRLRAIQDSLSTAKQVQAIGEDAHWWDKLIYNMQNLGDTINDYAQRAAVLTETKASEWINDIIRFIGELIFQMSYYGMLVAQRIFLTIMAMFAPIMFAMSLVPPFSNAWSSWMSKYLSLSLWGFVVYMCLYYIDFILMYNLQEDITAYDALLKGNVTSWSSIGALGLAGYRLELYVCHGHARRCVCHPLCPRGRKLAYPWWCQQQRRTDRRSSCRRYGRWSSVRCSFRCYGCRKYSRHGQCCHRRCRPAGTQRWWWHPPRGRPYRHVSDAYRPVLQPRC